MVAFNKDGLKWYLGIRKDLKWVKIYLTEAGMLVSTTRIHTRGEYL